MYSHLAHFRAVSCTKYYLNTWDISGIFEGIIKKYNLNSVNQSCILNGKYLTKKKKTAKKNNEKQNKFG